MNTWDLTDLYPSLDDASFLKDFEVVKTEITTFEQWASTLDTLTDVEVCESYIQQTIKLSTLISRLGAFASLTSATDASNSSALNALNQIQLLSTKTVTGQVAFIHRLKTINNLDELINSSLLLKVMMS